MIILAPGTHPKADKFWHEVLGSKPNGARTLGGAIADNLAGIFEPHYDMLITYASDFEFEVPEGVKKIAVIWHQNFPWTEGFKVWQRVNVKLKKYDVDYFVNESVLLSLIKDVYPKAYYLPRFIDTSNYPTFDVPRDNKTLWFGNAWGEFQNEFSMYKLLTEKPLWISHGQLGCGDDIIKDVDRKETLEILARTQTVWAIGVSQLEAMYYGCDIASYRGEPLPFYDQDTIKEYLVDLLDNKIRTE